LFSNGTVQCWGNNRWNQCDPVHKSLTDAIQVACGEYHLVALLANGTVQCWGNNFNNQCDPEHLTVANIMMPFCMLW